MPEPQMCLTTQRNLEKWDAIFASRDWGRFPPEDLVRFLARRYSNKSDQPRALEVGCGPGTNLILLAQEGFSVSGIDGSRAALDSARDRLFEVAPDAELDLRHGNFVHLPWSDQTFDLVIDIEAIYANTNEVIASTVAEVFRVLKVGGYFFAKMFGTGTTGYDSSHTFETGTMSEPEIGPCGGFGVSHFFEEDELRHLFAPFGELQLDSLVRTDHGRTMHVEEWLVQVRKGA